MDSLTTHERIRFIQPSFTLWPRVYKVLHIGGFEWCGF